MQMKSYKVDEIFDILSTNGIFHACNVNVLERQTAGSHPYVVRTSQNNGVKGYLLEDSTALNPGGTISFAQDTAQIFYQEEPYFTGNKIKVFKLKGHKLTKSLAMYLITCLNKAFSLFAWGQSFDSKVLADVELTLPVTTIVIPDWDLIRNFAEKVAGGGIDMGKIDTSSWKKFKISELFISQNGNVDIQKAHINGKGISVVSSGLENNGIIGKSDIEAKVFPSGTLTVDMFGNVFYRDMPYKMVTHARVFSLALKDKSVPMDEKMGLFLATAMSFFSKLYSFNNMATFDKIANLEILLPVTTKEVPDWAYMQERIAELEQERIAELEQYFVATGLNDYTLTDEDLKTLSLSLVSGVTKLEIIRLLLEFARK